MLACLISSFDKPYHKFWGSCSVCRDAWLASAGVPARWRVCEPDSLAGAGYEDKALETAMLKATMNEFEEKVRIGGGGERGQDRDGDGTTE